ncbi:MAG TPA: hypothetical protein VNI77_01485 [Nitrososphaera sp.]|nr:hypothetical protein [Nitrososphaera sp.]
MKYSATVLSGIVASILVSSFVAQAYAADVAAFLVPSRNNAEGSFIGVKTVTLTYPSDSSISQVLNGETRRVSFTLNGTAGQDDGSGISQAINLLNQALLEVKSPAQASEASISYTAVLRGDASRTIISYKTEIKPLLENYLLEDQGSRQLIDLEWRGFTIDDPIILNAPEIGEIDVNHPIGLIQALYPDIAAQLLNTDARQVLIDPILNFEEFDAPMSTWHVLFDPVGAYGERVGLQGTEGAQVLSVYSLGESSLREGTHEPLEKDASVTIDGANVRVHSTTPPPNAQVTIAGYSAVEESGGAEFAVVTLEAPAGVQTSTGGFPIQVLLVLGGMMGAIAIFILFKARK